MNTLVLLFSTIILATSASPDLILTPKAVERVGTITNADYRISQTLIPTSYSINLNVPTEALSGGSTAFSGNVAIVFTLTAMTNSIRIHSLVSFTAADVTLTSVATTGSFTVSGVTHDATTEIATILFGQNLPINTGTNSYTLTITYTGNLETVNMLGFYRSFYNVTTTTAATTAVTTEYLATTQFQPTHARRAFPCFDEPQFKATFVLSITHPTDFTARANTLGGTPVADILSGLSVTTFPVTPRMSTYLLAFTISKMTCTTSTAGTAVAITGNVAHNVCSREALITQRALALTYGNGLMNAMGTWTGVAYSTMGIPKVDQIAIPDFMAGAMENWGLVSYREFLLLTNEEHTSNERKQRIITVIAHEFAHMWFGNLITTHWWDTLFLNEGFATYFEYFLPNQLTDLATYELEKQFIIDVQQAALAADGTLSSPPLTSEAWTPAEIWNKFNTVSYSKGGSILRMAENVIDSTNFQTVLRQYITQNTGLTTTPATLWNAFGTPQNLPTDILFTNFINNWTNRGGYPVVHATLNGTNIDLNQERFLYSGIDNTSLWFIPIVYKTPDASITTTTVWLRPNRITVTIPNQANSWLILNHNANGYFRVNYDSALRQRIIATLESNHLLISDVDRAQIIDDSFNLARAGYLRTSEALQIINYMTTETSYYPWHAAIRGLNFLSARVGEATEVGLRLNARILELIQTVSEGASTTNWVTASHIDGLKLQLVWSAACKAGQQICISESARLFQLFKTNTANSINPNIRNVVYCNALRHSSDETDFTFLWNRLLTFDDPHEKRNLLTTLGCTRNTTHLLFLLDQTINSVSPIRVQDLTTVWASVYSSSPVGLQVAFEHFTANHVAILLYYPSAISILSEITSRLTTTAEIQQLENFVNAQQQNTTIFTAASAALTAARQNLELQQTIESDLRTHFNIPVAGDATSLKVSFSLVLVSALIIKAFFY